MDELQVKYDELEELYATALEIKENAEERVADLLELNDRLSTENEGLRNQIDDITNKVTELWRLI